MLKKAISIFLFFQIVMASNTLHAESKHQKSISIFLHFQKMAVIEDEKQTESNLLVDLSIFDYDGKMAVIWKDIYIMPADKKTVLNMAQYSTEDGTITDLDIQEDHFSFNLKVTHGRIMKVIGTKKGEQYNIEGVGLWWSDILKRKIKTEWKSVDRIVLPYKQVY